MMIVKVKPIKGFRLRVKFKDGSQKTVDMSPRLTGKIFGPLRNEEIFKKVKVDEGGGLVWPNGADICHDLLYWGGTPPLAKKHIKKGGDEINNPYP